MDRDLGLRRTTALTGALVAASLAGTLAVGLAARAAHSTETTTESPATVDSSTGATPDAPSLSGGADGSGQATSGGS